MLETLSQGFQKAKFLLQNKAELSEKNIEDALAEIRISLLEADVGYQVANDFLSHVKEKALGQIVSLSVKDKKGKLHKLSPHEHFIGICHEELSALMGKDVEPLKLAKPLAIVMMVGLQGSGKTTTTAKLAKWFMAHEKRKPLLVAADIYRPAAIDQLQKLGQTLGVPVYAKAGVSPEVICQGALQEAKLKGYDLVIFDTAGRLAIDETLMQELANIKALTHPQEIWMVLDAMIGQDAVQTAKTFHERLQVSGFVLTKMDGDARGGAALSIRSITQKPIRFLGMGEHANQLEPFRAEGLAGRILGMGDIVSLVKDFEAHVDEKQAEEETNKMLKGQFTFDDFMTQIRMIRKLGPLKGILERLPGVSDLMSKGLSVDDKDLVKVEAMVQSMTKQERRNPDLILKQQSRKKRIAKGSGHSDTAVEQLVQRFQMMRNFAKMMGQNPSMMQGQMPFGNFPQMGKLPPAGFMPTSKKISLNAKDLQKKKDKRKQEKKARKNTHKRK